MSYRVKHGKILTDLFEINAVDHCNLSCRACSHLSPQAERRHVDPDQVRRDLTLLARHCRAGHVRLVGGEPLLHPDLLGLIAAVRESGVSRRVRVVTNGTLLGRQPAAFWRAVDQVYVSVYRDSGVTPRALLGHWRTARRHGVELRARWVRRFREAYAELGTADENLVGRIFATCRIAHVWRCHAVADGRLYRCSLSAILPRMLPGLSNAALATGAGHDGTVTDGLLLAPGELSVTSLLRFLQDPRPPAACARCLGSVGRRFASRQQRRSVTRPPRHTEELVDWRQLRLAEATSALGLPRLGHQGAALISRVMGR